MRPLQAKVTTELSQLLEEEEKHWTESLQVEEYQISLAKTVIQVHAQPAAVSIRTPETPSAPSSLSADGVPAGRCCSRV